MERIDLFADILFLILGIACTVFIIKYRKRFDLWVSLLTCIAWILKGARRICYNLFLLRLHELIDIGTQNELSDFLYEAAWFFQGIDSLTILCLCGALVRMVMISQFLRWYEKAEKQLRI